MEKEFICTVREPVVDTQYGPVRGIKYDGIYAFKGIRYARAKRFRTPEPPQSWSEPAPCFSYDCQCPQINPFSQEAELLIPHNIRPEDEQCHFINVWTPTLDENAKKTVMVWIHGGGFAIGSSHALVTYEGKNLAQAGDIVVVSVNHRLNWLGYLDVSSLGKQYENSVNAGMSDLVFALQWVKHNIAAFGGNPEDVTLFGQSGGGEKIQALMQTPEAEGLFHRAIIQSGVYDREETTPEEREKELDILLKKLGISKGRPDLLETAPYEAVTRVLLEMYGNGYLLHFGPQKNAWYYGDIRREGLRPGAKPIDLLVGSLFSEFNVPPVFDHGPRSHSWEDVRRELTQKYGSTEKAEHIITLFREAYPYRPPFWACCLDPMFRWPTLQLADRMAKESRGKTYCYIMEFTLPVGEGLLARHNMDMPFTSHNTALVPCCNIPGVSDRLEKETSFAWIQFAKTGNPNHAALPTWKPYTTENKHCMSFSDVQTVCKPGFDYELARAIYDASHAYSL